MNPEFDFGEKKTDRADRFEGEEQQKLSAAFFELNNDIASARKWIAELEEEKKEVEGWLAEEEANPEKIEGWARRLETERRAIAQNIEETQHTIEEADQQKGEHLEMKLKFRDLDVKIKEQKRIRDELIAGREKHDPKKEDN
jgi:chromosome segregation ATPase